MSERAASVREQLDAWREQRADRIDPVRFHHMDALERRAARHGGDVRRLLDERLSMLVDAYTAEVERAADTAPDAEDDTRTPLGMLVDTLDARAAARGADSYPELPVLDDFRRLWTRLRTESQLRESLEQVPANAGPLNSGTLVHRSVALMREVAPGYLQHFVAYVDALSWMEQMGYGATAAVEPARAPGAGRKRAARSRARQD